MLAGYERLGVVVHGARSTVWKGFDPALKRNVALKQLTAEDAAVAARREASVLAGLRHRHIVSVYDVLDDDGVWLVEQWITGAALSAVVAQTGKLRAIDALALIHGALSGLAYAHGRDVVHGDIAPGNILINSAGTPMLVDFGLAVTPGQTSLGGTPGYMAPEGVAGKAVDKRSDVYSACVVLAELLKGTRLFPDSSLAAAHRQSIGTTDLDGIEAPVAAVLSTGLDGTPDNRPADAATLLAQLDEAAEKTHGKGWLALAGLGTIGSTAATIAAGTTLTGTTTTGTATAATTSTLSRGKLLAGAGAVVIAIVAIVLLLRPTPPPPHQTAAQTTTPPPGAAAAATPQATQDTLSGIYMLHMTSRACSVPGGEANFFPNDVKVGIAQRGNTITFVNDPGTLNPDGSFSATGIYYATGAGYSERGVFATEGGRTVIRDGEMTMHAGLAECHGTFVATKQ
jgi:serine/threonine protein kinase